MDGFTIIQNSLITSDISNGAFRLLTLLTSMCYGDKTECFPSQVYLSQQLLCSTRTIQRYLKELDGKYIHRKRRGSISNIYTVLNKVAQNVHSKVKDAINKAKVTMDSNKSKSKPKAQQGHFNDYQQREYDYDLLEKRLLGWDTQQDLDGSLYLQGCMT